MNFSKLFLIMVLGALLNNSACGMERLEHKMGKISITQYNEVATQDLQTLVFNGFRKVSEKTIKRLLDAGADPNIQNDDGWTLLYSAVYQGQNEVVELFLKAGLDPNIQDNSGSTALHQAVSCDYKEILEMLLKAGVDPNMTNKHGHTPLHTAAYWGYKEVVEMLFKVGADLKIKDNYGWTPLHVAVRFGYQEVVECIINFVKDGAQLLNDKVKRLTYLCSRDKIFRKKCETFLMSNKKQSGFLKIPKPLCYEILLQLWDPTLYITELVNTKDEKDKTVLELAREQGCTEIVMLLEPYENLELREVNSPTSCCILN